MEWLGLADTIDCLSLYIIFVQIVKSPKCLGLEVLDTFHYSGTEEGLEKIYISG